MSVQGSVRDGTTDIDAGKTHTDLNNTKRHIVAEKTGINDSEQQGLHIT